MFADDKTLSSCTWQYFERVICRLLSHEGYEGVRLVGQTGDKGADIIAHKFNKRWLIQVKYWRAKAGLAVLDETIKALRFYRADIPVAVALSGFDEPARKHQQTLQSHGVSLQLWDMKEIVKRVSGLKDKITNKKEPRPYQEEAIESIVKVFVDKGTNKALVVMATGLGKTFVAAEAIRRITVTSPLKVLVLAHTNELVYQLEKSFWPFLPPSIDTLIWNSQEKPSEQRLKTAKFTFACINSVFNELESKEELPSYDFILIDECHHAGATMYEQVVTYLNAGKPEGPFLLGLTATPWRPDGHDLDKYFGQPLLTVDMVTGLNKGFLSKVDYRMHTDNIDWDSLRDLKGNQFSPRGINRTLFINEWDSSVVFELQKVWSEQPNPRALVFCGTIDHAIVMRDKINALGFCNAKAIYSGTSTGRKMKPYERNRILCDFHDGEVQVVCVVDIFNEGVDVPDVNIIVFQRVTHSRRIFIQQLGRGLRLSTGKDKVIVLDFVSDIRRFAAGIDLKNNLDGNSVRIKLNNKVVFKRRGEEDKESEGFLREWLEDIAAIENAGEDTSVLKFPPPLPGGR